MSQVPLQIAVLGCGALAEVLAEQVYPAVGETVKVVAAVDRRPERARRIGQRLGARAHQTLEEACREGDVEAVDIRLPHHLHLLGARLAASAELPFLVEKPMAITLRDAREIAALARSVSVSCGVSENYAHLAPVMAAADLIAAGTIGELLIARSTRVFGLGEQWRRDGWRLGSHEGAGGVIVDQATHVARLLRSVVGEPVEVSAYTSGGRTGSAGPDAAAVAVRFGTGIIGTQTYCWNANTAPDAIPELDLYGTDGSISVYISYDGPGGGALLRRAGAEDEWHGTGTTYYDSLTAVLVEWARAVRAGREPTCSISEGVRDAAVMEAIAVSAAAGAPAVVPTVDDLLQ